MRKFLSLLAVLVLFCITAFAQSKEVTGRVTDQQGQPVPYASVRIKGSKIGTSADADGYYRIKANTGEVLLVSGTGLSTKEVQVTGSAATYDISIKRNEGTLTEVVVTALGIKKEAKAVGYSTATINSDALNTAKPINVAQGLIGQVSGAQVSIINNGVDPEIRIQLRGERHILADNQPLLIVDGMEVRNDFLITLNPEDVDNVSILKGASAAALYGSEASNGVMIVTTKRGSRNGKTLINLTQTTTAERLAYAPKLQSQFSGYGGEGGTILPGTPYAHPAINPLTGFTEYVPFENQSYGPAFNGNPLYSEIGPPNQYGQFDTVPFYPQKQNLIQQFFVTGITTQTDLSMSNGDAKNSNFAGMQFVNVTGTVPKDQSKRASVRFGGKRTIGMFSYDFTMNYSYKFSNTAGNDITAGWPIYWTLLNTQANIPIKALKDWWDPNSWGNLSNYYNAYYINPWWQIDNARNINKQDNLQGVLQMNLKPTDWFTASYRLSAQITNNVLKGYRNEAIFSPYSVAYAQAFTSGTPATGNIAGAEEDETTLFKRIQQDMLLTFQKKFGDIGATLIVGNTIWDRYENFQQQYVGADIGDIGGSPNSQKNGLILPTLPNISYYFGVPNVGQSITESRLVGVFGDLTFDYNSMLFLHGNYRKDYSSVLAPTNNSYSVYGVDASIIFSDLIESLKGSPVLSYGKLRGAYSKTGQVTVPAYSTSNTFQVPAPYPYGGLASLALNGNYNNPALIPEGTKEKEVGLELGFLRNRISAGATYYYDDNYNQLFQVGLSTSTGFSSAYVNAARTVSTGWEFDFKTTPVKTNKLTWEIAGNLAIQTTTVKGLLPGVTQTSLNNNNEAIVGMSFPQMYVQDLVRDSANGKVIVNSLGYPSLNPNPVAAGRTTPKYILGLTTTLTYMDFSLRIIGDYRGGYVFFNNAEQNLDFTGISAHTTENGRQNFIYPNSEIQVSPGKYAPNTTTYTQDGNIGFWVSSQYRAAGTSYVENASAWKLRTISLTYDFTRLVNLPKVFKAVKLTVLCNNVLMFRPKQNDFTDPEFNASNDNGQGNNTFYQLPPTRQYTGVVSFTF